MKKKLWWSRPGAAQWVVPVSEPFQLRGQTCRMVRLENGVEARVFVLELRSAR